ncbi:MAG: putative DNA modification/repair radical SAM protein [Spirochaetales bacterium]|nr:putative DNA modification/repair radical SAM protein [Spirochaetales bacterium]
MDLAGKISILADAAKYDASCSTSGSARSNKGGVGNAAVGGICHAWSADGRCVALLKVLLSNACAYDCAYCVNRRSNDVPRTGFEPEELVRLVMDFYRRNYIEGALLSSGVIGCPDATMERLIAVAKTLRVRERFNGYLHLKAIPGASERLVLEAARWADRLSVNIELPSAASLRAVASDKTPAAIFGPMRVLARAGGFEPRRLPATSAQPAVPLQDSPAETPVSFHSQLPAVSHAVRDIRPMEGGADLPARASVMDARALRRRDPGAAVLPAGQTTQMVVGASPESDLHILTLAENLYLAYDVRRVYYSAFVPTGGDSRVPALAGPPLVREHRLYQADWLFRFYGYSAAEVLDPLHPNLDPSIDPKAAWALRHLERFPVDANTADYRELLRVPGIGPRSASRIVRARRLARLSPSALKGLGVVMKRARWFVSCSGTMAVDAGRVLDRPDALASLLRDGADTLLEPLQLEFAF